MKYRLLLIPAVLALGVAVSVAQEVPERLSPERSIPLPELLDTLTVVSEDGSVTMRFILDFDGMPVGAIVDVRNPPFRESTGEFVARQVFGTRELTSLRRIFEAANGGAAGQPDHSSHGPSSRDSIDLEHTELQLQGCVEDMCTHVIRVDGRSEGLLVIGGNRRMRLVSAGVPE